MAFQDGDAQDLSRFTEPERELLRVHQKAKHELETKISRLKEEIKLIERLYGEVYNTRSALSVLPKELVSTIFQDLVFISRANGWPENPIAEVLLTHVCGSWRRLALSTPMMWNVFHYKAAASDRAPLDRLRAYLERSQSYPLEIWFNFEDPSPDWTSQHLEMVKLVVSHIHRCRTLHIVVDHHTPVSSLTKDLKAAPAPLLENLTVGRHKEGQSRLETGFTRYDPKIFLSGVPALRYLHLDEVSFSSFQPSFTSVVQLRLEKREESNPPPILKGALFDQMLALARLEALSIWGWQIDLSRDAHILRNQLIRARRLKHCRLDGRFGTIVFPYFLSHVLAPSLETLTMVGPSLRYPLITRDVDLFPSLHTLAVTRLAIDPTQVDLVGNLLDVMTVTKNIRRFVYSTNPALSFVTQHLSRKLSKDSKEQLKGIWTKVGEVTLNVLSSALDLFRHPATGLCSMKTLKVSQASLAVIRKSKKWTDLQETMGFSIEAIGKHDPILPFYWPAGSNWLDTSPDPFLADRPLITI